jgi:hypothetical protein
MNAEEIFNKAVELSDPTRQAEFLDKACAGDEKLRVEVDFLLKSHEQAGDFFESPAIDPDITLDESPLTEDPESARIR